jgi:cobalt/nickel transport system permease protein
MTFSFAPLPSPESPLRRIDARWKLAGVLLVLAGLAVAHTLPIAAAGLTLALVLAMFARMPLRWYLARVAPLSVFLTFFLASFPLVMHDDTPLAEIGGVSISSSGLHLALLIAAKAIGIVTLMLVVLVSSPLNQTLAAAHSLRVPGLVIQVTLLAYQYLSLLAAEARRLRIALRVRGFRNRMSLHSYKTLAHLAGAILVRGHARAERVAQAMRCRGFTGKFLCLETFRTRTPEIAFFVLMSGASAAMISVDWLM